MKAPRLLFVGFDAMDASIARRLVDEGRMPNLAGLMRSSSQAVVRNPDGLVVGGVWPTFATGSGPGDHGFYCFRQIVDGRYRIRRFDPFDIGGRPFWEVLSDAGVRCGLVDMPLTRPSEALRGVQVVDWGTHDRMLQPCSSPAAVLDEIVDRHGPHPVDGKCDDYSHRGDWSGLLAALRRGVDARVDVSLDLMGREAFDFFGVVFSESHCAGHQFWRLHDPDDARFDPEVRDALGCDPLEAVYEACDAGLGRLLAAVGPDTEVVVLLSHGIGNHHDADHLLDEILRRIEAARWPCPRWRRERERAMRAADRLVRAVEARRRPEARPWVSTDGSRMFAKVPNNELHGAIRVNVRGREPRGFVEPGAELEAVLAALTEELLALTDPVSGRPVVNRVMRADDLYSGPRRSWLPDLFVDWNRVAPISAVSSPTIGTVTGVYDGVRSGDHRPSGLVVAPGAVGGEASVGMIDMADLAPTICAALGLSTGAFAGRAAEGLLAPIG